MKVAAPSERETDALVSDVRSAAATLQSAARNGVVAGGGLALARAAERLEGDAGAPAGTL